mmetsp:Transcript_48054/g.84215  ORF Transcript_48054/g.84215 Transcript_48054/m.84215 type:complete len:324 (+) Transcript_48054:92-1063(+)
MINMQKHTHLVGNRGTSEELKVGAGVCLHQGGLHRGIAVHCQRPQLPYGHRLCGRLDIHRQLVSARPVGHIHQRTHGSGSLGEHALGDYARGLVHDRHFGLRSTRTGLLGHACAEQSLQAVRVGHKLHQHVLRVDGEQTHSRLGGGNVLREVSHDQLLIKSGVLKAREVVDQRKVAAVGGVERRCVHVPHVRQSVQFSGRYRVSSLVGGEIAQHTAIGGGDLNTVQSLLVGRVLQVKERIRDILPCVSDVQVVVELEQHRSGRINGESDNIHISGVGVGSHFYVRETEHKAWIRHGHNRTSCNVHLLNLSGIAGVLASHDEVI